MHRCRPFLGLIHFFLTPSVCFTASLTLRLSPTYLTPCSCTRLQCCDGDLCNDSANQVKKCLVSSADGSSSSAASCPAASDLCVTATSSALGMTVYACSSQATALFGFDCADSPGTGQYMGFDWAMEVPVASAHASLASFVALHALSSSLCHAHHPLTHHLHM